MGSEWGQLDNKRQKKMKTKIFSAFISTTRLQFPRTLPVFWLNQASHRNAKGTIGCRIECSIQPWGQNEASLTTKKKKMKKKFFRYITAVVTWKLHEHCLFCGWTKRLTEMPRAPLDAELNALFNHGVRMRTAWQEKKKKMKKKIFSAFITTTRLQFPRTLPVFSLNQASQRNAKGTIGCIIECSIQPWGQNEASLTTKKKKNEKKDFFVISQQ